MDKFCLFFEWFLFFVNDRVSSPFAKATAGVVRSYVSA